MPKPFLPPRTPKTADRSTQHETLRGWQKISSFFGEPVSVIQRWASQGMPLKREGRFMVGDRQELTEWLAKQSGKPVHIADDRSDLASELKRGLAFVKEKTKKSRKIG